MLTAALPRCSDAVVVMGVASCGKTTVGRMLAEQLFVPFTEGDALHTAANVAKMSAGIALTDDDRWPWLAQVGAALKGTSGHIVSCSALKFSYRQAIEVAAERPLKFIHLHGTVDVLRHRISQRKGHFMPASLLDSQLGTLEIPTSAERALTIDIDQPLAAIVDAAAAFLREGLPTT
jgi:gluconokinase